MTLTSARFEPRPARARVVFGVFGLAGVFGRAKPLPRRACGVLGAFDSPSGFGASVLAFARRPLALGVFAGVLTAVVTAVVQTLRTALGVTVTVTDAAFLPRFAPGCFLLLLLVLDGLLSEPESPD